MYIAFLKQYMKDVRTYLNVIMPHKHVENEENILKSTTDQ